MNTLFEEYSGLIVIPFALTIIAGIVGALNAIVDAGVLYSIG